MAYSCEIEEDSRRGEYIVKDRISVTGNYSNT